ncbi:MAG: neutral/alkaline non-lysosomal ceramidase N-terminal domain-containing protein [Trueperaceae bacterium]|nr:neutral/alkaline non-lysosomal ceramidase N-terminal domain-containing protein [Trueperaceae bacterium]
MKPCSAQAGFGRADFTPEQPVIMSGFAARAGASQGIHDRLEARCMLALSGGPPVAVLTFDVIGIDSGLCAAARETVVTAVNELLHSTRAVWDGATPLTPDRVAVACTHTHSGPATLRSARLGEVDPAVLDMIVAAAHQAATAAVRDIKPGWFRYGSARVDGVAVNRRVPDGPVDSELQMLGFWPAVPFTPGAAAQGDSPSPGIGGPSGLLATFALHPVVLGPDNLLLTRDYVGYVLDDLESSLPGCVPMWATGFAGQINHGHLATASSGAPSDRRSFAEAGRVGRRLAEVVKEAVARAQVPPDPGEISAASLHVDLAYLPPRRDLRELATEWRRELVELGTGPGAATHDHFRRAVLPLMAAWADDWATPWSEARVAPARRVELQSLGIEGVSLVFCPGEPFVEYALALKRNASGPVMPIAYANDAPGYLPTAAAHAEGGYEVDSAYMFYGEPGVFGPESEGVLGSCLEQVAREVRRPG